MDWHPNQGEALDSWSHRAETSIHFHLYREVYLILNLGTLYKADLLVIFMTSCLRVNYLCFSKNLGQGTVCDVYHTVHIQSNLFNMDTKGTGISVHIIEVSVLEK